MNQKIGRHLPEVLLCGLVILLVAFWVVNTARNGIAHANRAVCLSNVNQISAAIAMYRVDNDQYLPPGPGWHDEVWAYADQTVSYGILVCPSRSEETGFGYGLNHEVGARNDQGIGRPSEVVLLCDVRHATADVWWANDIRFLTLEHNGYPLPCHREKAVFAFCDGHVKALDPFVLDRPNWMP